MFKYYTIYKPFNVLSQFSNSFGKKTLKDYFNVPSDVYPVGRLDFDSEGLLILTNDKKLNHLLLDPYYKHEREYWLQVEGIVSKEALVKLSAGVKINIDGKIYNTQKCKAELFINPPAVPDRDPPIRIRKTVPDSWLAISLIEGKNRQVRKMTASVGFPTLRLIRYRIENLTFSALKPGQMKVFSKQEMYNLLNIKY